MKPTCLLNIEKGTMVWVVFPLLTVVVIAAVLVIKIMPGASTPSAASPPAVAKMKIASMPKAEPKKADGLQPPEVEWRVETPSDRLQDDSTPVEPNVNAPAALTSPADASGAAGTASAQESVREGADLEPPSANAGAPTVDATSPAKETTEVAPEQEAFANRGEPVQTATLGVAEDAPPGAASESTDDLVETKVTAVVAAKAPETPAAQDRPEPTGAATTPENEALFTVQVGAFRTKAYADAQLEKLKGLGYPAYIFEVMDKKQQPLYLVCFGRFQTLAMAADTIAAFKEKEKMPAVVARPESW